MPDNDNSYSYDENSEVWPNFIITIIFIALSIFTYSNFKSILKKNEINQKNHLNKYAIKETKKNKTNENNSSESIYKHEQSSIIDSINIKSNTSNLYKFKLGFIILAWILLIFFIFNRLNSDVKESSVRFDPYEILDISYSASTKQIKSAFRKLSLKFHPDKISNVEAEAKAILEEKYMQIIKAYQALTNEESRKNFLEYGDPDGPSTTSTHGIALPMFTVGSGSPLVIALYIGLIGIVLPFVVGKRWSGSKIYTKHGIHTQSADSFFTFFVQNSDRPITPDDILDLLSTAKEFNILMPGVDHTKVRFLLDAYLSRSILGDNDDIRKFIVASRAPILLEAMLEIACAFKRADPVRVILKTMQHISQAVPPSSSSSSSSELLQLPNVNEDTILERSLKGFPNTLQELFEKNESEQKEILGLTDENDKEKFNYAIDVARKLPVITIVDAYFKSLGEELVAAGDMAHLVLKFTISHFGDNTSQKIDPDDLQLIESPEILKNPLSSNNDAPEAPQAFTPYLPAYQKEKWYVFISNRREDVIIEGPKVISHYYEETKSVKTSSGEVITPKITTFKMNLTAPIPDSVGEFPTFIELWSNSYFGSSNLPIKFSLILNKTTSLPLLSKFSSVTLPYNHSSTLGTSTASTHIVISNVTRNVNEDSGDISDPEPDSIAGTMAQLRGEKVKSLKQKSKRSNTNNDDESQSEENSDDYDSDGSYESDELLDEEWTDIVTDTEDEEENEKSQE